MRPISMLRAVAAAAIFILCAGALHAQGKLEIIGGDTHDWGKVAPGKLTTIVKLKNIGSADLNVLEVRPTCLCTIAPIDKNLLKPGETAQINITLDATTKTGDVERNIIIRTSDSSSPQQVLHLKANVQRDLTISPSTYIVVESATKDVEKAAAPITITNTSSEPITLFAPGASQGNVKVRFDMPPQRELKPGEKFEVKAFVTPLETADISGTVKMKTSTPQMQFLTLTVTGTMAQPATAAPSSH